MSHELKVFLFTLGLFVGMLLFLEIVRRMEARRISHRTPKMGMSPGNYPIDAKSF